MDTSAQMHNIQWKTALLKDMTGIEVFSLLKLRSDVFVVEQECIYADADEKDMASLHMFGSLQGEVVACARLVPPNISYAGAASIGRVCNVKKLRGTGIGKLLMQLAIAETKKVFGSSTPIKISAQHYLLHFYTELGFEPYGEIYLEDDIPHIGMVYKK